jgi:cofilin
MILLVRRQLGVLTGGIRLLGGWCRRAFFFLLLSRRSPAASRIRAKILYATSKQGLRRLLDGVHYEVQATDPSEMGFDVIRGRAQ